MSKDIATLLGGFLTALLFFLSTVGIAFDWFTEESINAFVVLVSAAIALAVNIYAVWKNTYTGWFKKKENTVKPFSVSKAYEEDGK